MWPYFCYLTTFWPFFDTFKEQESFFQQNETFYMNHNNKPDILVHVWILCHIWVNFSFNGNFPIPKGFWAIWTLLAHFLLLILYSYSIILWIGIIWDYFGLFFLKFQKSSFITNVIKGSFVSKIDSKGQIFDDY